VTRAHSLNPLFDPVHMADRNDPLFACPRMVKLDGPDLDINGCDNMNDARYRANLVGDCVATEQHVRAPKCLRATSVDGWSIEWDWAGVKAKTIGELEDDCLTKIIEGMWCAKSARLSMPNSRKSKPLDGDDVVGDIFEETELDEVNFLTITFTKVTLKVIKAGAKEMAEWWRAYNSKLGNLTPNLTQLYPSAYRSIEYDYDTFVNVGKEDFEKMVGKKLGLDIVLDALTTYSASATMDDIIKNQLGKLKQEDDFILLEWSCKDKPVLQALPRAAPQIPPKMLRAVPKVVPLRPPKMSPLVDTQSEFGGA